MQRLSERVPGGAIRREGIHGDSALVRLAAYEDIHYAYDGTERITLDRLAALVDAERDGRVVVLPCKVGDMVKVSCKTWGNCWNYKTVDHGQCLVGAIVAIVKTKTQTLLKIQAEHNVQWKRERRRYPISALGRTVFLVRAEAEAKGEQE